MFGLTKPQNYCKIKFEIVGQTAITFSPSLKVHNNGALLSLETSVDRDIPDVVVHETIDTVYELLQGNFA